MSKKEFAIKGLFEDMEKKKDPVYRKAHRVPSYMWQAFGLSLLGGICGGLIFFAVRWWFSVFSVLFFLLNGIGAYAFCDAFLNRDKRNRRQIWMILLADFCSVFATLTMIYLLVPDYASERVNKGHSVGIALLNYFFSDTINIQIWVMGLLMTLLGTLLGYLLCRRFSVPSENTKKGKRAK